MKHRIRKTREIISVISFNGDTTRTNFDSVSYIDSKGRERKEPYNYYWDLEEVEETKEVSLEETRLTIAKDILVGLAQNCHQRIVDSSSEELARWSIETADELIKQLKNK